MNHARYLPLPPSRPVCFWPPGRAILIVLILWGLFTALPLRTATATFGSGGSGPFSIRLADSSTARDSSSFPPTGRSRSIDPTASISARIFVSRQRVRITLEEFTDDLVWLHGMEANQEGLFEPEELRRFYSLHQEFLADRLQVLRADGTRLKAVLVDKGPYPFDEELLESGATEFHLVKRKMSFTFEYASDESLDVLTIQHRIVDENFLYPAELSLELFQGSSDLSIKSKLRVDTPMTIAFDWENPIPSLSASEQEIQAWLEAQQERMLGVTEFGAVYCWGYIEARRLRVELLFPLNVLETMFEIPSRDPQFLQGDELDAASRKIGQYFTSGNPVHVNGQIVEPNVGKVDFFPADQRDFAVQADIERLSFANGRVGITLYYPYTQVPTTIELQWDKFSRALNTVQAYLYHEDKVTGETFSRQVSDNRIRWENPGNWQPPEPVQPMDFRTDQVETEATFNWLGTLAALAAGAFVFYVSRSQSWTTRLPLVILMVGVGFLVVRYSSTRRPPAIKPEAGKAIAEESIARIYRSFEFADEEEIYDQLSVSVAGPQLRDLYLQLLQGLTAEEQGGAVSSIEHVQVTGVEFPEDASLPSAQVRDQIPESGQPQAAFECQVQWDLRGLVEHWGHSHERTNHYLARAWFAAIDDQWKMIRLNVQSQDPGLTKPRPRKFTRTDEPDPT